MKHGLPRAVLTTTATVFLSLILAFAASSRLPDSVRPCAPCHGRAGSDQVGQWLASPYSEKIGGRGCIDCHGGECPDGRESADLPSLRKAVRLSITVSCPGEAVNIEVAVANVGVGHVLPSGPGGRILMLDVTATDGGSSSPPWRIGSRHLQLPPFSTDISRYRLVPPRGGPVHVSARLVLVSSNSRLMEIAETAADCGAMGEES